MNVYRIRFGVAGREVKLVTAPNYAAAEEAFRQYAATREFGRDLVQGIVSIERLEEELVGHAKPASETQP